MKLTKQILGEQILDFTNSQADFIEVTTNRERFQLWLNGKIVKSTKSLKPIQDKLNYLLTK